MKKDEVVYLLWLHDSVRGVYKTERKAANAARRFRQQREYVPHRWSSGTRYWTYHSNSLSEGNSISRLEIEERSVL